MPARGRYYFDKEKGDAAVAFFSDYLCFVDGEWAGRPFRLSDWQANDVRQIFGWRKRKDGRRRYRMARIWVPRKNGKTTWAAGIAHLLTLGDGEPGAQVFSHALQGAQAELVFQTAARMVELSPTLSQHYEVTKTSLFCPALMSSFRYLSGEAYGKHGLSPHANIGDEAHAWRNGRLHTFLIQGMGARRQPLDITISTAGEIKTYGHELYETSKAILADPELDPETYVSIYEAPPEADWTDPKVWAKANPNLGVSQKLESLQSECNRALQNPRLENDFRRYHLNQWVEQAVRWLPMINWPLNTRAPEDPDLWRSLPEEMRGRRGYLGLDLGSTSDLTAQVWVFPPEGGVGRTTLVPRFWVPADTVKARHSPLSPYRDWIREGALEVTPGNVTDYDWIEQAIIEDAARYSMPRENGIAVDAWNATQVAIHLQNEGMPVNLFRQNFPSMNGPCMALERLFQGGMLEHGNHPVLRWMFGNATTRSDPTGLIKPDKVKAAEKIDGVVATIMALGLSSNKGKPAFDFTTMVG